VPVHYVHDQLTNVAPNSQIQLIDPNVKKVDMRLIFHVEDLSTERFSTISPALWLLKAQVEEIISRDTPSKIIIAGLTDEVSSHSFLWDKNEDERAGEWTRKHLRSPDTQLLNIKTTEVVYEPQGRQRNARVVITNNYNSKLTFAIAIYPGQTDGRLVFIKEAGTRKSAEVKGKEPWQKSALPKSYQLFAVESHSSLHLDATFS
jgi:hypothetical protein